MACTVKPSEQFWTFDIDLPNTGEMNVSDPLLDTIERAEERVRSEFLKNAYVPNAMSFRTYRTDLKLNDIINVGGMPYIVSSMSFSINDRSIVTTVNALRYEQG